jgi:hypothetical protein
MGNLTREQILARKTGQGPCTLPDGSTVQIRGLTQKEVLEGQQIEDLNERTCFYVSKGLTDPALSYEDVLAWSESADAGDLTKISEDLQVLSRLTEGAGKSGVSGPRGRRRS